MEADDATVMRDSVARPEAFETVFERYHPRIWAYLARRGGRERADELAGDVFVTAFAQRSGYDPARGSVAAWLYGIAAHRLQTRFRTDLRAAGALRRAAAHQAVEVALPDGTDDAIDRRALLDQVVDALARMPLGDREVITMFAWERLSYEEIAAALGIEVGTVRSRLSRARARLRELLLVSGEVKGERRV